MAFSPTLTAVISVVVGKPVVTVQPKRLKTDISMPQSLNRMLTALYWSGAKWMLKV
jgi:hypothetical protein